jgi:hypothetical protein
VRRAMQTLPLRALIREIQNIDVFLADFASDTHQASLLRAAASHSAVHWIRCMSCICRFADIKFKTAWKPYIPMATVRIYLYCTVGVCAVSAPRRGATTTDARS